MRGWNAVFCFMDPKCRGLLCATLYMTHAQWHLEANRFWGNAAFVIITKEYSHIWFESCKSIIHDILVKNNDNFPHISGTDFKACVIFSKRIQNFSVVKDIFVKKLSPFLQSEKNFYPIYKHCLSKFVFQVYILQFSGDILAIRCTIN
jgi:hypothetical protein